MKCDGINMMFPFAKQDISYWGSRYEPKNIQLRGLYKVRRQHHVYQAPENSCFIAVHGIGAHKALFKL